ncbi:uncharacterized protein PV09_02609 [Verruconis gallopava]|uniref:DUF7603 domain-containing protein n=1 Tax=Verruconis gallopava TaxID=253628 RepID=A0A0D2AJ69_9PEZI|nr:uncharacterized protein PV09_02609 [Verruconis gallopava]KIW06948.1 hypothetical protein PV09_02609 [Verruconis gallopava]
MSTARTPADSGTSEEVGSGTKRRNNLSLSGITIPLQGLSILKRKPLPANSPVHAQRSASLDSPGPIAPQQSVPDILTPISSPRSIDFVPRDLDKNPHGNTPLVQAQDAGPTLPTTVFSQNLISPVEPLAASRPSSVHNRNKSVPITRSRPSHDRTASTRSAKNSLADRKQTIDTSQTRDPKLRPPVGAMTSISSQSSQLRLNITSSDPVDDYAASIPKTPRSPPGRKLSNFFGFRKSPGPDSPSTYVSGGSQPVSPMPVQGPNNGNYFGGKLAPAALDVPKANALYSPMYVPGTPGMPSPPISTTHAADLEQELRELSTELANSLRREMELEDELEKLRAETSSATLTAERRTSDYFSDAGTSSMRFPGEGDGKIEQLERLRRAAEQEKAQLKIQMSDRLQDALNQRREAEERNIVLYERLKAAGIGDGNGQSPAELKIQLEETKRKLSEESQFRQNFQDLVGGMRLELEQIKNERDNLRDEVVPQLRSRIEGLENDAANNQSMTYEHTRLSQEVQALRNENQTLVNARRLQMEMQRQSVRFSSIEEDGYPSAPSSPSLGGLSRSKSFAVRGGRSSRTNSIIGSGTLTRATSVKDSNKTHESREALIQKVKDIETQRDALHKALKSLLERHLIQEKKHAKQIKQLERELHTAQTLTPRRTVFHNEVKQLRDEIQFLRKRADDALDQKWQLEKNFSGVKMDLDRAREETASLRALFEKRDMFLPERPGSRDGTKALDKAYKELRTTHALSIAHLKEMETNAGLDNSEAERTLELLKQSISDAEAERDAAQSQAAVYREQARNLQKSELDHLSKEQSLAAELYASAQRMDALADQVQSQIESNSLLRQKLAEAVERGEREQKNSATKISEMQTRLRDLEDKLVAAQQQSEIIISSHEQEVKELKEAHNAQLQRTTSALVPPNTESRPISPVSGLFAPKSPIKRVSMAEASKTSALESKVRELEKALHDAEAEMSEVVDRMNRAQIEVAELQSERDEAMMQSRRLQAEYLKEREKVQQLMLQPDTF